MTAAGAARGLNEYNRKRRFGVTPEPPGRTGPRRDKTRAYVVQKHRASHLHYDLRLEHDGVMLSWAVPKGPSCDPSVKRLAMQTEDHPIEYNEFEGVIPEGEYGGGTVMIWDRGTWEPEVDDVGGALAKGDLKLTLRGVKLGGSWVLVRTRNRQWLLIKHRDASASATEDVTIAKPLSVVSRRSMAQIAHAGGASPRQLAQAADADPPAVTVATVAALERRSEAPARRSEAPARQARGRRVPASRSRDGGAPPARRAAAPSRRRSSRRAPRA